MSSMRNAVQRRNHRERAQPQERSKWGLLEKPKDYKLRAADHKVKKRKIKALQQKASERNEDEFYFAMMSNKSQGGVKVAKRGEANSGGGKTLSNEVVKLMKTQDVGYLRTMLQQTKKERQRLEQDVISGNAGVNLGGSKPGKKLVFDIENDNMPTPLSSKHQAAEANADDWFSEDENTDGEGDADLEDLSPEEQQKRRLQTSRQKKLDALRDREEDLSAALDEVETQRAKMNGSIGGVNKNGVKFKVRNRKR